MEREKIKERIQRKKGFISDMDGVIYMATVCCRG